MSSSSGRPRNEPATISTSRVTSLPRRLMSTPRRDEPRDIGRRHLPAPDELLVEDVGRVAGDQRSVEVEEGADLGPLGSSLDLLDQVADAVHLALTSGSAWPRASSRTSRDAADLPADLLGERPAPLAQFGAAGLRAGRGSPPGAGAAEQLARDRLRAAQTLLEQVLAANTDALGQEGLVVDRLRRVASRRAASATT